MVEDYAQAQANSDLLNRYVQPAVIALAEQLELDLFTLYTSFTGTAAGTAGTDLTATPLRTVVKNMNLAKAPMQDRYLVLSPKDQVSILGDSNLASFFAFSDPDAIKQGQLPNLYGLQPYVSQLVTVVAGTPNDTKNIAFHKSAMMLAMRTFAPIPAGSGVATATVVDEESGIAIRVLKQYKAEYRAEYVGFDILYGFVALRPNLGFVVDS